MLVVLDALGVEIEATSRGADGEWSIEPLRPGKYTIQVDLNLSEGYASAVTVGGTAFTPGSKLVLPPGSPPTPIDIRIGRDGGGFEVSVADALGPTVAIVAIADFATVEAPRTCGERDKCIFQGLGPGDYSLYAFRSLDDFPYAEPEALRQVRPVAKVTVQTRSTQRIEIKALSE
jgi:hypothetical protein